MYTVNSFCQNSHIQVIMGKEDLDMFQLIKRNNATGNYRGEVIENSIKVCKEMLAIDGYTPITRKNVVIIDKLLLFTKEIYEELDI